MGVGVSETNVEATIMNNAQKQLLKDSLEAARDTVKTLEMLVPPQGSDSGDLLPDTRSVGGNQSTKNDGSEKPLPDQGGGALSADSDTTEWNVWLKSDEGNNARGEVGDEVFNLGWNAIAASFVAGRRSMESAPLTQSGADGDELEETVRWISMLLIREAAHLDQLVSYYRQKNDGWNAGLSERSAAEHRRHREVLKSLFPEESRKERSVSGNAIREGPPESATPQHQKGN